jgi:hypothetical protein
VLVVPLLDAVRPRWPMPDRLFLRTICDYLEQRRLITTEIYVRGPVYLPVYVTVGVQVQAGYFPDVVRQSVTARLYEYLSALPPGGRRHRLAAGRAAAQDLDAAHAGCRRNLCSLLMASQAPSR